MKKSKREILRELQSSMTSLGDSTAYRNRLNELESKINELFQVNNALEMENSKLREDVQNLQQQHQFRTPFGHLQIHPALMSSTAMPPSLVSSSSRRSSFEPDACEEMDDEELFPPCDDAATGAYSHIVNNFGFHPHSSSSSSSFVFPPASMTMEILDGDVHALPERNDEAPLPC